MAKAKRLAEWRHNSGYLAWVLAALLFTALASIVLRWDDISNGTLEDRFHYRWWKNEVAGHTAEIFISYEQALSSGLSHSLLPGVPFSRDETRSGINEPDPPEADERSAARLDRYENRVYLSFPPGSFLAAFLALKAFFLPVNLQSVRLLGAISVALTSVLMAMFVWVALVRSQPQSRVIGALFAGLMFQLSSETWHSGISSVWAHHFAQPVFIGLLVIYIADFGRRLRSVLLTVFASLACLFEWSGYPISGGLVLWSFIQATRSRTKPVRFQGHRNDCVAIGSGVGAALIVTLAHYQWAVGIGTWLHVLSIRSAARLESFGGNTFLEAWLVSANGWLVTLLTLVAAAVVVRKSLSFSTFVYGALFALTLGNLEDVVFRQHAFGYSFSSYKLLSLIGLLIGLIAGALWDGRMLGRISASLAFLVGLGMFPYYWTTIYGLPKRPIDGAVCEIGRLIVESARREDLIYFIGFVPWGTDVCIGEKPVGVESLESAKARLSGTDWCSAIVVEFDADSESEWRSDKQGIQGITRIENKSPDCGVKAPD